MILTASNAIFISECPTALCTLVNNSKNRFYTSDFLLNGTFLIVKTKCLIQIDRTKCEISVGVSVMTIAVLKIIEYDKMIEKHFQLR